MRQPARIGGMRRGLRLCAALACLLSIGCQGPASTLDCSGEGVVRGNFAETNTGAFALGDGLVWRGDAGYMALFTQSAQASRALRVSPAPEREAEIVVQLLGESLLGAEFDQAGQYRRYFVLGAGTVSGWGSDHRGALALDAQQCARGSVSLGSYGATTFALPLLQPALVQKAMSQDLERGSVEPAATSRAEPPAAAVDQGDPMASWAWIHAQLEAAEPLLALQTLGLSPLVAQSLAADERVAAALHRLRSQCPDPATAQSTGFGYVEGEARPSAGIVLQTDVAIARGDSIPLLARCRVLKLVDERWHECLPIWQDCRHLGQ